VAGVGAGTTVANMAGQIGDKLFNPEKIAIKAGGAILGNIGKGFDIQFDFAPEGGNGGMAGPFSGGWEMSSEQWQESTTKSAVNLLSGGIVKPVESLLKSSNALFGS
jgi:hypothetical protein